MHVGEKLELFFFLKEVRIVLYLAVVRGKLGMENRLHQKKVLPLLIGIDDYI
jgi:hypothetical protein